MRTEAEQPQWRGEALAAQMKLIEASQSQYGFDSELLAGAMGMGMDWQEEDEEEEETLVPRQVVGALNTQQTVEDDGLLDDGSGESPTVAEEPSE
jgi:hypothetical protein